MEGQTTGILPNHERRVSAVDGLERVGSHFEHEARAAFGSLMQLGFVEVEATPTLLRFSRSDVEVDIYHGRQSFEVGVGVTAAGNRYSLSEIIRTVDPAKADSYRNAVATTPEGLARALAELNALLLRYGSEALVGNREYLLKLEMQRQEWSEGYALKALAEQLRPRAEDAFRSRDYATAAKLYARFEGSLTSAEAKKLAFARSRGRN